MKNPRKLLLLPLLALAILLSGCSGELAATSWPGLSTDQNNAYVAYGPHVYAVRLSDGTMGWRFPEKAGKGFYATPEVTADSQLIVGGFDNVLYSLNPANGTQNWTFQPGAGDPKTEGQKPDRWVAPVLPKENSILAPSTNSFLYNLDPRGKVIWSSATTNMLWAQPLDDDGVLYQSSMDHSLYAMNEADGSIIWKVDLEGTIIGKPAMSPEKVLYVGTLGNQLFAVDSRTGKIVWEFPTAGGVWSGPALVENNLFFGDLKGNIYIVDAGTGKQVLQIPGTSPITASPLITTDKAIFVNEAGVVTAFDLAGKQLWNRTINGKLYTTPVLAGDRILVGVTQGDQLLVTFDQNGNQGWSFAVPK